MTGGSGRRGASENHGNDSRCGNSDLRISARLNDGCSCLSTSHSRCKCSDRRSERYKNIVKWWGNNNLRYQRFTSGGGEGANETSSCSTCSSVSNINSGRTGSHCCTNMWVM